MAEGGTEDESGEMLGPAAVPHQSPSALNVLIKAESSDRESSLGSPEPASTMGLDPCVTLDGLQPPPPSSQKATHLNGAMAGLGLLQNLQSLASLQSLPQVASLAASMATAAATAAAAASQHLHAPLNLSVGGGAGDSQQQQPPPLPQLILASGQLVQGIQGAQLLIPTSQGIATQTILTIPVSTPDHMVNLALSNGHVQPSSSSSAPPPPPPPPNERVRSPPTTIRPPMDLSLSPHHHHHHHHQHHPPTTAAQQLLQTLPQLLSNAHMAAAAAAAAASAANHYPDKLQQGIRDSPPSAAVAINRLNATSNGELTITTTPTVTQPPTPQPAPPVRDTLKRSPSLSPPAHLLSDTNNTSTVDLLIDSPNQPTINQTSSNVVDGINLDEIKDFAKAFKLRRLSLGLTQTQVGQALSVTEGPAYSQSAICRFEKLDITPKSAQKIKPVLERWMKEAEDRYKSGQNHLTDFIGIEPSKKRKRRTSFTPQALELLNAHFERNTHPSGTEITGLAHQLGYEREVIRIWFCNKRQALKNTVRMMSKGIV